MKQLKISLKLLVLFMAMGFMAISCQKEDITTPNQAQELSSASYKVTSLSELTKLQPVIGNIKRLSPKTNAYNRGFGDVLPLENIDTTRVIQYTDTTGYSTYTFKIENDDETSINFENLCLLETEQGYIAYILSYEPDETWYFGEDNYTPEGDHVFNIPTYQGDITKYSLEREVIWSTKEENLSRNDYSMRSGGMYLEECMYSTYEECCNMYAGNPTGACHPRGPRCEGPFGFNVSSSCQMVWISTGGGNGDGSSGGGGTGNDDDCTTSGTTIVDDQPIAGIGAGCTPNDGTGILITDVETTCTLGVNVTTYLLSCLQINSFTQMELQDYIENPDNACQVGSMATYLVQNQCSEQAQDFAIAVIEALADDKCAFLPIISISEMIVDYDSDLFGDYPDSSIQQDHTLIKQQYEQQLENNGALSAVNFLIDIYNMETFGSDNINVNYTISFSNNVNEGDGLTIGEFNPISGELIGCEIILENDLLTLADFGYVARAIKHELYHVLQNQFYGLNGISDAAMEFDAYFSSIYRFNNLPRVSEPNKIIQLVVWLESNWDIMPESEKMIRQDQYNIVSNMFPKICNDD